MKKNKNYDEINTRILSHNPDLKYTKQEIYDASLAIHWHKPSQYSKEWIESKIYWDGITSDEDKKSWFEVHQSEFYKEQDKHLIEFAKLEQSLHDIPQPIWRDEIIQDIQQHQVQNFRQLPRTLVTKYIKDYSLRDFEQKLHFSFATHALKIDNIKRNWDEKPTRYLSEWDEDITVKELCKKIYTDYIQQNKTTN